MRIKSDRRTWSSDDPSVSSTRRPHMCNLRFSISNVHMALKLTIWLGESDLQGTHLSLGGRSLCRKQPVTTASVRRTCSCLVRGVILNLPSGERRSRSQREGNVSVVGVAVKAAFPTALSDETHKVSKNFCRIKQNHLSLKLHYPVSHQTGLCEINAGCFLRYLSVHAALCGTLCSHRQQL